MRPGYPGVPCFHPILPRHHRMLLILRTVKTFFALETEYDWTQNTVAIFPGLYARRCDQIPDRSRPYRPSPEAHKSWEGTLSEA